MHRRREDPRAFLTSALTIHLPSTEVSFPLHSSQLKTKSPTAASFFPLLLPLLLLQWGSCDGLWLSL